MWADTLSRELDTEDSQLNPHLSAHLQSRWGPHFIDRFASMLNTQLPRFNARWRDPQCEDVDCLRLPDAAWRCDNKYCNPLDCSANPRRQPAPVRRSRYRRGPLLAQQTVVPRFPTLGDRNLAFLSVARPLLSRQARQACGSQTTRLEHRGLSSNTPLGSTLDVAP
jgi:hypothetical protein